MYRRNLTYPMNQDNTDSFVFLALTGLALFDADLKNTTEETVVVSRKSRQVIQKEIMEYHESYLAYQLFRVYIQRNVTFSESNKNISRRYGIELCDESICG
ncbi:hypothetical protein CRE_25210 [Caenorhabditis remanei]|uniref:NR LBD domain-containing protein n=1 Tax=Caenorhabditis remanei TaxID=31234 RepID=E3LRY1_CAERE|nr:hypothetical protein CRE_25210 [Caenorhabditis remanei]